MKKDLKKKVYTGSLIAGVVLGALASYVVNSLNGSIHVKESVTFAKDETTNYDFDYYDLKSGTYTMYIT